MDRWEGRAGINHSKSHKLFSHCYKAMQKYVDIFCGPATTTRGPSFNATAPALVAEPSGYLRGKVGELTSCIQDSSLADLLTVWKRRGGVCDYSLDTCEPPSEEDVAGATDFTGDPSTIIEDDINELVIDTQGD